MLVPDFLWEELIMGKLRFSASDADLIDEAKRIQLQRVAGFLTCLSCKHTFWCGPWKSAKTNKFCQILIKLFLPRLC